MKKNTKHHIKESHKLFNNFNFKSRQSLLGYAGAALVILLVVLAYNALKPSSHAQIPSTPSISDVCGATLPSNVGISSAIVLPPQSTTLTNVLSNSNTQGGNFKLFNSAGTEEIYVMSPVPSGPNAQQQISIYNLATGAQIGSSFPVDVYGNSQYVFTLDPSGNVYVVNSVADGVHNFSVASYSPSGVQLNYHTLPSANFYGAYSYVDSSNNWYFATTRADTVSGPDYNVSGQSYVFNSAFVQQANNNIVLGGDVQQDSSSKDLLGFWNNDTAYVYGNNPTIVNGITTFPIKFSMGSDIYNKTKGPLNFYLAHSIVENPNSGYYISTEGQGIMSFNANGGYLGTSTNADQSGNYVSYQPGVATVYNGNLFYYSKADTFGTVQGLPSNGIYKVSLANLNTYVAAPNSPSHFGVGAGMSTTTSNNYFNSSTTPTVNMTFYPWWGKQASNFIVKYQVRSVDQIQGNQNVTEQTFNLSSFMNSSTSTKVDVPLTLAGNTSPGAYQISARIYNASNPNVALGADCLDYSVGSSTNKYNPANNTNSVEIAHQLGQSLVRSNYGLEDCISSASLTALGVTDPKNIPNSYTFPNVPTVDCNGYGYWGNSPIAAQVNSEMTSANKYGITYIFQLDTHNTSVAYALARSTTTSCPGFYNGTSISDFQCVAYQMAKALPSVNTWEQHNEMAVDPPYFVDNFIKPSYIGIKQAGVEMSKAETVYGGSFMQTGADSVAYLQSILNYGNSINYMDGIDNHGYTPLNMPYTAAGAVVPQYDVIPGQAVNTGGLDQKVALMGSKPVIDSEFGSWTGGTTAAYNQPNNIVTGTILQNSVGINKISVFANSQCDTSNDGEPWGTIGCGHDGGDYPGTLAQTTMQAQLDGATVSANRKFNGWLPTGTTSSGQYTGAPHVYAAQYGPSATDAGSVVVIWADEYTNTVIPRLSGGGTINITSEFGATSTVNSGSPLTINGRVQYLYVPAGQTISFAPTEAYGPNLALSAADGGTATVAAVSSTSTCSGVTKDILISGSENLKTSETSTIYNTCNSQKNGWSQKYTDTAPYFTINLGSSKKIDRVFIAGTSGYSNDTKVGSLDIQTSTDGTNFTTVKTIPDEIFQRNHMAYFNPVPAQYVKVVINNIDITGVGNGMPPIYWPLTSANLANENDTVYGAANVFDIEVYASGTASAASPTVSITTPANNATVSGTVSLASTASETGGTISKVQYFLNGSAIGSAITVSPYTYSWDTSKVANGTYSLTSQATDANGVTSTSSLVNVTVNNVVIVPTTPTLSATATNSSTVTLNWSASTEVGGPGVAAYYITRTNGTSSTTFTVNSPTLSYADTTVSASTTYSYTIQAADTVAVLSGISLPISVTTPAAPVVVPNAPTNLTGSAPSYSSISLSWTGSTSPQVVGYHIFRSTSGSATYTNIGSSTNSSYTDTNLSPSTQYSYKVEAYDSAVPPKVSAQTSSVSVTTPAKPIVLPTAPTNLTGSAPTATSVSLTWNPSTDVGGPGLAGYYILRTTSGTSTAVNIGNTSSTTYTDNTAAPSTTYSYQIQAYDSANPPSVSSLSNSLNLTTPAAPQAPAAPTGLTATPVSTSQINLAWNASTNTTSYDIYKVGTTTPIATGITSTSYGVTNLSSSTSYSYYVTAINSVGPSPNSNTISATTLANPTCPVGQTGTPPNCVTPMATVNVVSPTSTSVLSTQNITATINPAAGKTIAKVELFANGALVNTATTPSGSTYSFIWNTIPLAFGDTNYPDGTYTLTAVATDTSGVTSTSSPVTVYVDNGDVDGFKCVTLHDFSILASHYNQTVPMLTLGDIDANSIVQLHDFSILASNYGYKQPGSNCGGY
jgi:hypothetical protein